MLRAIAQNSTGISLEAMDGDQEPRVAEAFVVNSDGGESLDPHRDERLTVVFYPVPGSALLVSHNTRAQSLEEIRRSPATLVIPRQGDFLIFNGLKHPYIGISFGITSADSKSERASKFSETLEGFNIKALLHNHVAYRSAGKSVLSLDELVEASDLGGDRIAIGLNYMTDNSGKQTALDQLFNQVRTAEPNSGPSQEPRL